MGIPRWIVGPAVATIVLAFLGFPPIALFASGGGVLMGLYVVGLQQRTPPPGTSFGGPNVPPP